MSAFWDSVADEQMTHSDEPTTAEERSLWATFCAEEEALRVLEQDGGRIAPFDMDDVLRLIADVKRLTAERDKFRDLTKRAAVGGLPLAGVDEAELIDKLETENKRLRDYLIEIGADTGP